MKIFAFVMALSGVAVSTQAAPLDCQPPEAGKNLPVGVELPVPDEFIANCTGKLDPSAFPEPVGASAVPTGAATTPVQPLKPVLPAVGSGEGAILDELEQGTGGGVQTQYNDHEMVKVGEFDALQGRPVNMAHANNLEYLQGYTQGQRKRAALNAGGNGVPGSVPVRSQGGIQLR